MPSPDPLDTGTADSAPLWRLGVQALTQGYAEARFTPVDALQAVLQRLQAVQPTLNPVATLDAERALQAAQASTRRWQAGAPRSPLDGVPVTIKDSLVTGGLRTTWGSRVFEQNVPEDDELPVARLRQAGALLFAKTNVPEFTVQGYTDNGLFGTTRNPWNPALTPGGSSGGAVCAVASGVGPLALGTDGGGSIRRPAGHCGLVGLKPTTGRIARHGGLPEILLHFEVVGPIGRTVADVATMLDVLAGPDRRDAASLHLPAHARRPAPPRLRILHLRQVADGPVDPVIDDAVAEVARRFAALGHEVHTQDRFDLPAVINQAVWPVLSQSGVAWLLHDRPGALDLVGPGARAMAEAGAALPATALVQALNTARRVQDAVQRLFEDFDLLLTPTAAAMPWPATEVYPPVIDGKPAGPRGHAAFTAFVNAAGVPALALPAPAAPDGMPIGFQLVGRHGDDALLCALGAAYEAAHPWAHRWPPSPGEA